MKPAVEDARAGTEIDGPPRLESFAHVSVPCRDLEEGTRFYRDVLGGVPHVTTPTFNSFIIAGANVGIGTEGCSWITPQSEYPHIAFFIGADELPRMKAWLDRCGIPTSNYWTRSGVEALMFFRDPSGNVLELYCESGFEGAEDLPRGPPRGHGTAVDIDALVYTDWNPPKPSA